MNVPQIKMTFLFFVNLALLIFIFLNSNSYTFTTAKENSFRFFQVEKYLFACNSTHYWHVFSSEADRGGGNGSSSKGYAIRFNMVGPHRLMEEEGTAKDFNITRIMLQQLKFVFVGHLQKNCTVLVLVDSELNYNLGRIHMSANLSETIRTLKAPFYLDKSVKDDSCGQTKLPESTGHLSGLPFFSDIFGGKNTAREVSSVFSLEHSSVLYVLGTGGSYFRVNLHKNGTASGQHQQLMPLEQSRLLDGKVATLYSRENGQKFMLLQSDDDNDDDGNGTVVCPVISLSPSLQLGSACKLISTYDKQQQKLGRGIDFESGEEQKHQQHLLHRIHNGTATDEEVCNKRCKYKSMIYD